MAERHVIAFDAGGTAVKAALYDARGAERAVAAVGMAPLHPAPGFLERDPEAMWAAVCDVARKVLSSSGVAPSSIVAVGLTGYGNGLFLIDRDGQPVRNAILSPDQRAQAIVARWRAEGAEARSGGADLQFAVRRQAAAADRLARGARAGGARARRPGALLQGLSPLSPDRRDRPRNQRHVLGEPGRPAPSPLDAGGARAVRARTLRAAVRRRRRAADHRRRRHRRGGGRNRARRRNAGLGRLRRRPGDGPRSRRDRRKPDQRDRRHLGPQSARDEGAGDGRIGRRR